jgi:hypothetical protein
MKINAKKTVQAVAIIAAAVVTAKVAKAVIAKVKSGKKDKAEEAVSADIARGCDCENEACDCACEAAG